MCPKHVGVLHVDAPTADGINPALPVIIRNIPFFTQSLGSKKVMLRIYIINRTLRELGVAKTMPRSLSDGNFSGASDCASAVCVSGALGNLKPEILDLTPRTLRKNV